MKIILLDNNPKMVDDWKKVFIENKNLSIINDDFVHYMANHINEVNAIVSPANSFGLMDGGYDGAITAYFGRELMEKVQEKIINDFGGEQPVGTSISVEIPNFEDKYLIHTPSMRWPEYILDNRVVMDCTRTALLEMKKLESRYDIETVILPAFGGCAGAVNLKDIAELMHCGFLRAMNPNETISWQEVRNIQKILKERGN